MDNLLFLKWCHKVLAIQISQFYELYNKSVEVSEISDVSEESGRVQVRH